MNKKLILTESQYSRLLEFIEEAGKKAAKQEPQPKAKVEPNMDAELSNPKFKKMKDELLNQKPNTAIIFDLIDGTKITMCIGDVNGSKFTLKVSDVKGDKKKESYLGRTVEMDINSLELVKDDDSSQYKIKIKHYVSNKKNFVNDELFFNTINVGTPCVFKQQQQPNTKTGTTGTTGTTASQLSGATPEEVMSMGKKAMDEIINDPELKKAFYKAPSLWNLFMAELKGKKAPGTGIVPTLDILSKYFSRKEDELSGEFEIGKEVSLRFVRPHVTKKIKDIDKYVDNFNKFKVIGRPMGERETLLRSLDSQLQVGVRRDANEGNNRFVVSVSDLVGGKYDKKSWTDIIEINPKQSNGYKEKEQI